MDKIVINQELLLLLQKNKIIATTSNFNYRDQAVISLIKTLITMGYNSSDILELIDEEMTLLDILDSGRFLRAWSRTGGAGFCG